MSDYDKKALEEYLKQIDANPYSAQMTIGLGLVLCAISVYVLLLLCQMPFVASNKVAVFNKDFMAQFNEEYQAEFGRDAPVGGHPDHGNGYFGRKLSYANWLRVNNAIRVHTHHLELIFPISLFMGVAALGYPLGAVICAWVSVVGRIWFGIGQMRCGNVCKGFGSILIIFSAFAMFGLGLAAVFKQWKPIYFNGPSKYTEPLAFPFVALV